MDYLASLAAYLQEHFEEDVPDVSLWVRAGVRQPHVGGALDLGPPELGVNRHEAFLGPGKGTNEKGMMARADQKIAACCS